MITPLDASTVAIVGESGICFGISYSTYFASGSLGLSRVSERMSVFDGMLTNLRTIECLLNVYLVEYFWMDDGMFICLRMIALCVDCERF